MMLRTDADMQTGLVDVFNQFTDAVSQWQTFWDIVDEIDSNTCVLEPEKPTRAAAYRRLALGFYRCIVSLLVSYIIKSLMAASYSLLLSVLTFKESYWMFYYILCLYTTRSSATAEKQHVSCAHTPRLAS